LDITSLKNFGSGMKKLLRGFTGTHTDTQTQKQQGDLISLLSFFFKIRKVGYYVIMPKGPSYGVGIVQPV
jgi:hypothetical protein